MVQIDSDKTDRRKHQILMAASRVFRRKGLQASGMRDIAAEMGMHVSNLYYYFENKQALLAYCQEETLDRLLVLARETGRLDRRVDGQLHWLIRGHVRVLNAEIPASLAHLEVEALAPEKRRLVSRRRRRERSRGRSLAVTPTGEGLARYAARRNVWAPKRVNRQTCESFGGVTAPWRAASAAGLPWSRGRCA